MSNDIETTREDGRAGWVRYLDERDFTKEPLVTPYGVVRRYRKNHYRRPSVRQVAEVLSNHGFECDACCWEPSLEYAEDQGNLKECVDIAAHLGRFAHDAQIWLALALEPGRWGGWLCYLPKFWWCYDGMMADRRAHAKWVASGEAAKALSDAMAVGVQEKISDSEPQRGSE